MQHKDHKVSQNEPIVSSLFEETGTQKLPQLIICFHAGHGQPENPRAVVALILFKEQICIRISKQTGVLRGLQAPYLMP